MDLWKLFRDVRRENWTESGVQKISKVKTLAGKYDMKKMEVVIFIYLPEKDKKKKKFHCPARAHR